MGAYTSAMSGQYGIDVQATVDQILYAERLPERMWQQQQTVLDARASALRDMRAKLLVLEDKLDALKDLSGAIRARTATSSSADVLSAFADTAAVAGTHTVVVSHLATTSSTYSRAFSGASETIAAGTGFTLKVGSGAAVAITFDASHNTLQAAAAYINEQEVGVTASIVTGANGARLALVGSTSGAAGTIEISNDTAGLGFSAPTAGENATLTVDGVPVEAGSNTVTDVIQGVTIELAGAAPATTVYLKVAPDKGAITQAVKSFVTAFNDVIGAINAQFAYDPGTKKAGVLAANASLRGLQQQLLSGAAYEVDGTGAIGTLRSMGVNMKDDGSLEIDATALNAVVDDHAKDLESFFQETTEGFAFHMAGILTYATDTTDGPIALELSGIDAGDRILEDRIADFEARMLDRQRTLIDQYSRIDTMLRKLPLLESQLNAQLGSFASK